MKKLFLILFFSSAILCFGKDKGNNVRVVSLSPNMTETIFALGKEDCLVGRSSACDYPAGVKDIPIAGNFGRPTIERVIALKPDYIVSSNFQDKKMVQRLKQFGIKVLFLPGDSFDDYFRNLKVFGDILNCKKKAEALRKKCQAELDNFKAEAAKNSDKVKVLFVIWDLPLMTVGKDSFITDIITYAGGKSITGDYAKAYFNCSLEWVLANPPDILVLCKIPVKRSKELIHRPGWENLKAVRESKFYHIETDLVCRMGPRSIEGIRRLNKIFKDFRKNETVK